MPLLHLGLGNLRARGSPAGPGGGPGRRWGSPGGARPGGATLPRAHSAVHPAPPPHLARALVRFQGRAGPGRGWAPSSEQSSHPAARSTWSHRLSVRPRGRSFRLELRVENAPGAGVSARAGEERGRRLPPTSSGRSARPPPGAGGGPGPGPGPGGEAPKGARPSHLPRLLLTFSRRLGSAVLARVAQCGRGREKGAGGDSRGRDRAPERRGRAEPGTPPPGAPASAGALGSAPRRLAPPGPRRGPQPLPAHPGGRGAPGTRLRRGRPLPSPSPGGGARAAVTSRGARWQHLPAR